MRRAIGGLTEWLSSSGGTPRLLLNYAPFLAKLAPFASGAAAVRLQRSWAAPVTPIPPLSFLQEAHRFHITQLAIHLIKSL